MGILEPSPPTDAASTAIRLDTCVSEEEPLVIIFSNTAPVGLVNPTDIVVDLPIHDEHFDFRLISTT